jgi:hypothetical protein
MKVAGLEEFLDTPDPTEKTPLEIQYVDADGTSPKAEPIDIQAVATQKMVNLSSDGKTILSDFKRGYTKLEHPKRKG